MIGDVLGVLAFVLVAVALVAAVGYTAYYLLVLAPRHRRGK